MTTTVNTNQEAHKSPEEAVADYERRHRARARVWAWRRHTFSGLAGWAVLGLVIALAWTLSFNNLTQFAISHGIAPPELAWMVPGVFDLGVLGMGFAIYQARGEARLALVWRVLLWALVGVSALINWMHVTSRDWAGVLAALLPVVAALLYENLASELHRRAERDLNGGRVVPRLTLACWALAPSRAFHAFRRKTLRPLAAAEDTLGIPRAEPTRLRVDLESVGRAFEREHTGGATTPVTSSVTTGVSTPGGHPNHPPVPAGEHSEVSNPVATPVATRAQTGRDQDDHPAVSTPGEHDHNTRGHTPQMAVFNPLDQGPAAAHEQGEHTRAAVAAAHREHPEASHRELADRLGVSRSTVRRHRPVDHVNGS